MSDRDSPSALLFDGRGGAQPLDRAALDAWKPDDGTLWARIDADDDRDRAWLESPDGLKERERALFLHESAWPRAHVPGTNRLYLLLRVLERPAPRAPPTMSYARLWIEPQRVITMASEPVAEWKRVQHRLKEGTGPTDTGTFMLLVIEQLASRLADYVLRLRPEMAEIELEIEHHHPQVARLHRLRHRAIRVQSVADPQRAQLLRMRSLDLGWLTRNQQADWNAVIDYFDEGVRELDLIVQHCRSLDDSFSSKSAEQMNRRIYALTYISAMFLPLTLAVGLFGMNISTQGGNILGAHRTHWFIFFCFALVGIALGVYTLFKTRILK